MPALVTRVTAPQRFTCFAVTAASSLAVFPPRLRAAEWRPLLLFAEVVVFARNYPTKKPSLSQKKAGSNPGTGAASQDSIRCHKLKRWP